MQGGLGQLSALALGVVERAVTAAQQVRSVLPLLRASRPGVRAAAARVLGNCGADTAPVIPSLLTKFRDTDASVRARHPG